MSTGEYYVRAIADNSANSEYGQINFTTVVKKSVTFADVQYFAVNSYYLHELNINGWKYAIKCVCVFVLWLYDPGTMVELNNYSQMDDDVADNSINN